MALVLPPWIDTLFRWTLVVPVALVLPGAWAGFVAAASAVTQSPEIGSVALPMPLGAAAAWFTGRFFPVLRTLEHELTHALVGLPFGLIPYRFVVTARDGGYVKQFSIPLPFPLFLVPMLGSVVMGLAPYSIPLFALVGALVLPADWRPLVGFFAGYHLWCKPGEIWNNAGWGTVRAVDGEVSHTDIRQAGHLLSLVMIPSMALLSYGLLFAAMTDHGLDTWATALGRGVEGTLRALAARGTMR
jgi:hypothetical protein